VEPGITLPLILLKPLKPAAGGPSPAVLAFAQEGKSGFLAHRAPEILRILDHGATVILADLRGTGELARATARHPSTMGLAAAELMLGNTLAGARLKDARAVFRYAAGRSDIDRNRIVLWGDSFGLVNPRDMLFDKSQNQPAGPSIPLAEPLGPMLALMTAYYEPQAAAVATRRGLASFQSVLADPFAYVSLDVIVPGLLEVGDLPALVAAIAPRPVLIQAEVDGRNRPLAPAEESDLVMLADWIVARLR